MKKAVFELPIIMLSMSRWDGPFSSASLSLAKEFSKNNLVFYVDNPYTLKDFLFQYKSKSIQSRRKALIYGKNIYKRINSRLSNLIAVTPRLVLPINWMAQGRGYDFMSDINNKVIISTIRKIKIDYKLDEYILFNSFNPFYGQNLPKDIKPHLTIYQSRDDISESMYVNKHGVKLESKAIVNADLAMATSLGLVKKLSVGGRKVSYLPNAADITIFKETFNPLERPVEIKGVKKKIIGYTGNICHRINYELIKKIALTHSDKILLLVGPINNKQFKELKLDTFPNIITTGAKPIDLLPSYLKYMDCAIIPFHCNELTKSIYPLKINEYLAAGKPVISTNFSEDIVAFKKVIYLANNDDEFLKWIDKSISENDDEKIKERVLASQVNTWEARVKLFWELIDSNNFPNN